jgi:hypothetical protein
MNWVYEPVFTGKQVAGMGPVEVVDWSEVEVVDWSVAEGRLAAVGVDPLGLAYPGIW